MAPEVAEVLESTKSLDRDQLADLAYELIRALEGEAGADEVAIDAAWQNEVAKRVQEIDSGNVALVDGRETIAMARALLGDLKR